jgi:hypothetical protein
MFFAMPLKLFSRLLPGLLRENPRKELQESFLVGAPAFMRGEERFSAPGKSKYFDHAL